MSSYPGKGRVSREIAQSYKDDAMMHKLDAYSVIRLLGEDTVTRPHRPRQRIVNLDKLKVRTRTMVPLFNTIEEIVTNEIGWKVAACSCPVPTKLTRAPRNRFSRHIQRGDG